MMDSLQSRSKQKKPDFTSLQSSNTFLESTVVPCQHWLQLRFFNLPFLAAWVAVFLFITIAIGTLYSYFLYSIDYPTLPIYELTKKPTSLLCWTRNTHLSGCGLTLPYFASKSNFFNQYFVKLGWAWTSLAVWGNLAFFTTDHRSNLEPNKDSRKKSNNPKTPAKIHHPQVEPNHLVRSLALHCTATILWIFFTQWFFGISLIDRLLVLTGAKCIVSMVNPDNQPEMLKIETTQVSNNYCERQWGQNLPGLYHSTMVMHRPYWSGGMDISGHVFLLSSSILTMISTLTPSIRLFWFHKPISTAHRVGIYANLTLVCCWWWMLLMTSLYFHEPIEKFAGLVVGVGAWWTSEMVAGLLMG